MDWPNERYIRIYIRDTLTWKRMRFEGQTVFMHVARKLDRAGRLPLDGMTPAEALAILTDVPEDYAVAGFERLLDPKLQVFKIVNGSLVAPNWVEAQEAKASPAQRQRESREKKKALLDVTQCDDDVTKPDAPGHDVTEKPEVSRGVTPSLAELSLAEPSLAVPPDGDSETTNDTLLLFAQGWRKLTGRSEFKDFALGHGPPTGTEMQWLTSVRKTCGGSAAEFCARVSARMAEDPKGFLLKQTLLHWERGPLQAPAKAPSTPSAPTAAYHAPLEPRADEGPAVSYADAMAEQEPS